MNSHVFPLHSLWFLVLGSVLILSIVTVHGNGSEMERKVHIVYMGDRQGDVSLHRSMLNQVIGSDASELLIHSYQRSFNGFAAKLTDEEVRKLANTNGVVSVFPNRHRVLHTTKSWNFVGFPLSAARATIESDVIIGMLDSGIWPESDSFSDEGFGSPPSKWKGTCQSSNFTCNKFMHDRSKIIGARYYLLKDSSSVDDVASARDSDGHGSHTASTAAGRQVSSSSLFGFAEGTARGGVPSARIAVYKVCWSDVCADAEILAAFDDAIADGVDIISISVGTSYPLSYFEDSIAIGAFHAMKNGILTSNSGGNSGPDPWSIANTSPWSLTVAANTIDRRFMAEVKLGNGQSFMGASINTFDLNETMYPLVYGGDAANNSANSASSRYCYRGSLNEKLVKGKIVLCDDSVRGGGPLDAGALGAVMQSEYTDSARAFPLPSSVLGFLDGGTISKYVNTTSNPTLTILKSQELDNPKAPYVVSFSSRGPNPIIRDILKPDLSAPGVDILAAWSPMASMSSYSGDKRSVSYNIISGTSMACPHATGAAAYVKSYHPSWSPAAIKSALMTTARQMSSSINEDAEFAYGAGQIDPVAAVNPGLVYDVAEADYIRMLCGQGYSSKKLWLVTGDSSSCSSSNNGTVWDLNYPSFALSVSKGRSFSAIFNRTVTNVGLTTSSYKITVTSPSGLTVSVEPSTLSFESLLEKQSFSVKLDGVIAEGVILSASLVLYDGVHYVRSPIVVYAS